MENLNPSLLNLSLAKLVLKILVQKGVQTFCLCPGGRNAPFVEWLSRIKQPSSDFKVLSFFEERSMGFFALGRVEREGRPVALFSTSGTAAVEFLPAAVEAFYSGLPLAIITADRPLRLTQAGVAQSLQDTAYLFTPYCQISRNVSQIEELHPALDWIPSRGSLHLNVRFEEPLLDEEEVILKEDSLKRGDNLTEGDSLKAEEGSLKEENNLKERDSLKEERDSLKGGQQSLKNWHKSFLSLRPKAVSIYPRIDLSEISFPERLKACNKLDPPSQADEIASKGRANTKVTKKALSSDTLPKDGTKGLPPSPALRFSKEKQDWTKDRALVPLSFQKSFLSRARPLDQIDEFFKLCQKPLILSGGLREEERGEVLKLLSRFKGPFYTEPASGLDHLPHRLLSGERILSHALQSEQVDGLIRLGGIPRARVWRDLEKYKVPVLSLASPPFQTGLSRNSRLLPLMEGIEALSHRLSLMGEFALDLKEFDRRQASRWISILNSHPQSEQFWLLKIKQALKPESRLFLGNSSPIRFWDQLAFEQKELLVSNQAGVNGIEGLVSRFLGLCQAEEELIETGLKLGSEISPKIRQRIKQGIEQGIKQGFEPNSQAQSPKIRQESDRDQTGHQAKAQTKDQTGHRTKDRTGDQTSPLKAERERRGGEIQNVGIFGDLSLLYDMAGFWPYYLGESFKKSPSYEASSSALSSIRSPVSSPVRSPVSSPRSFAIPSWAAFLINNFGGQIFSRQFKKPEGFLNTHDLRFSPLAKIWGLNYTSFKDSSEFFLPKGPAHLIEILPDERATKACFEQYVSIWNKVK